jgi:hypothetical protein
MKLMMICSLVLMSLLFLVGCEPDEQEGSGQLPENGVEVVTNFVKSERFDTSGGRIVYVEDAPAIEAGEKRWCVNVRFINTQGLFTIPIFVSQRGDEWRIERNPDRAVYESYGCVWPVEPGN